MTIMTTITISADFAYVQFDDAPPSFVSEQLLDYYFKRIPPDAIGGQEYDWQWLDSDFPETPQVYKGLFRHLSLLDPETRQALGID